MSLLEFTGEDFRLIFDTLVQAWEVTKRDGRRPTVLVNGKRYESFELDKVAHLVPDEDLSPAHQAIADQIFQKRQKGYRRTTANLATRASQIESHARRLIGRENVEADLIGSKSEPSTKDGA